VSIGEHNDDYRGPVGEHCEQPLSIAFSQYISVSPWVLSMFLSERTLLYSPTKLGFTKM